MKLQDQFSNPSLKQPVREALIFLDVISLLITTTIKLPLTGPTLYIVCVLQLK